MKKIALLLFCIFILGISACKDAENPATPVQVTDSTSIDDLILGFMSRYNIPGGAITMSKDGNIVYSKGYGIQDPVNTPVTDQSLFRLASCSKPFTAVGIMQLVQNGQLNLNDNVFGAAGILNQPEYQNIIDPQILNITVQNLLNHTGGWNDDTDSTSDPMFMAIEIANAEGVPAPAMQPSIIKYVLANMPLDFPPGTQYAYSNFGFCVLGRVIEKVTGQTYENYIRSNVLIPSGITDMQLGKNLLANRFPGEVTYYGTSGEMTTTSVYNTGEIVPWPYAGFNIEAMDAHGQWIASTSDLMKFLQAVRNNTLISPTIYNMMITVPAGVPNDTYACGWGSNSDAIWHQGSLPGTSTEIVNATNGFSWALVFNKRSESNQLSTDLDNLGWNIQQYIH